MSRLPLVVLYLLFWMSFVSAEKKVQCRGPDGDIVDWFFVYKLPEFIRARSSQYSIYKYITSSTINEGWKETGKGLDDDESMLVRTLSLLYDEDATNYETVLYNDRDPMARISNGLASTARGVIMADSLDGFWLIHSVPSFPHITSKTSSLWSLRNQGGHFFLCISVQSMHIDLIIEQLNFNQANVYYKYPLELKVGYERWKTGSNIQDIYSTDLMAFKSFAHSEPTIYNQHFDFFCDVIIPELKNNLYVKSSTLKESTKLADGCKSSSQRSVTNLYNIKMKVESQNQRVLTSKRDTDLSKWAISSNNGHPNGWDYVCISDVDRTITGMKNGGGAVCVKSRGIWEQFKKLITDRTETSCGNENGEDISDLENRLDKNDLLNTRYIRDPEQFVNTYRDCQGSENGEDITDLENSLDKNDLVNIHYDRDQNEFINTYTDGEGCFADTIECDLGEGDYLNVDDSLNLQYC